MKKYMLALLCAAAAWPAFAFDKDKRASFEIAYERSDYTYKEPHMDAPIRIKGPLNGVSAKYTYRGVLSDVLNGNDGSFVALDFRYMGGSTDYDGWLQTTPPTPYTIDDIGDYYLEGRVLMGEAFYLSDSFSLWPYMGIGYRFLKNHANKKEGGYRRESNYVYVPLGTDIKYEIAPSWTFALNGEFDWFLKGRQVSQMSDVDPGYADVSNRQSQGYGVRFSARLQKDFTHAGVFVEPFWRYWHIQNSDWQPMEYMGMITPYALMEPFNTTQEYGLKAGLVF